MGPAPKVFLIGGGPWDTKADAPPEMYWCKQFVFNQQANRLELAVKAPMTFPRHGHSACAFGDSYIVVTGSRKDHGAACQKAEVYNVAQNSWTQLAPMNFGRHYHSSCSFNNQFVYVFCGIQNNTKKYFNSIERVNMQSALNNLNARWDVIQVSGGQMQDRQGVGTAQIDPHNIMILGGFGGKYFRDSWFLDTRTNKLTANTQAVPQDLFAF